MSPGARWPPFSGSRWRAAGPSSRAATAADVPFRQSLGVRTRPAAGSLASVGCASVADGGLAAALGPHLGAAPAGRRDDAVPDGVCSPRRAHPLPRLLPPRLPPQLAAPAGAGQPSLPHASGGRPAAQRGLSPPHPKAAALGKPSDNALLLRGQLRLGLHQLPGLPPPGGAVLCPLRPGIGGRAT